MGYCMPTPIWKFLYLKWLNCNFHLKNQISTWVEPAGPVRVWQPCKFQECIFHFSQNFIKSSTVLILTLMNYKIKIMTLIYQSLVLIIGINEFNHLLNHYSNSIWTIIFLITNYESKIRALLFQILQFDR